MTAEILTASRAVAQVAVGRCPVTLLDPDTNPWVCDRPRHNTGHHHDPNRQSWWIVEYVTDGRTVHS